MNLTIRQLRAFLAVHQEGSFTKAAESLYLTQSALSSIIKGLESNLGLRLFDRTTRQLEISEAGKNILPTVIRMLNEMNALTDEVKGLKKLDHGRVRIAIAQQLASVELPEIIAHFNKLYPLVEVSMIDCGVERVQEIVNNAEADIGIGPERKLESGLSQQFIFSLPFHLVVAPDHSYAKRPSIRWEDLKDEDLISLSGSFTKHLMDDLLRKSATHLISPKLQVSFMSTALSMVKHGLGVTLCLPYVADLAKYNNLVMLPITNPVIQRNFYLYQCENRSSLPAVQRFIDVFLKKSRLSNLNN